ncbi:hypothetical protein M885DRAFT_505568 [Pelagophyceae sp. CCMP2097]|nr:hypothetical protein M885DRAFT_505568 [Pelagophyceae sp. CCMP2097]
MAQVPSFASFAGGAFSLGGKSVEKGKVSPLKDPKGARPRVHRASRSFDFDDSPSDAAQGASALSNLESFDLSVSDFQRAASFLHKSNEQRTNAPPPSWADERAGMAAAEKQQRQRGDKFFGVDRVSADAALERVAMADADADSRRRGRGDAALARRANWDRVSGEQAAQSSDDARRGAARARDAYLRAFAVAESSDDVAHYQWPAAGDAAPAAPSTAGSYVGFLGAAAALHNATAAVRQPFRCGTATKAEPEALEVLARRARHVAATQAALNTPPASAAFQLTAPRAATPTVVSSRGGPGEPRGGPGAPGEKGTKQAAVKRRPNSHRISVKNYGAMPVRLAPLSSSKQLAVTMDALPLAPQSVLGAAGANPPAAPGRNTEALLLDSMVDAAHGGGVLARAASSRGGGVLARAASSRSGGGSGTAAQRAIFNGLATPDGHVPVAALLARADGASAWDVFRMLTLAPVWGAVATYAPLDSRGLGRAEFAELCETLHAIATANDLV